LPGKKSKSLLKNVVFWKLFFVCNFLVMSILFCLLKFVFSPGNQTIQLDAERAAAERAKQIDQEITFRMLQGRVAELMSIENILSVNSDMMQNRLNNWIESKPDYASVSVWIDNQKWAVRAIRNDFWRTIKDNNAAKNQQDVFQYILKQEKPVFPADKQWVVQGIFKFPDTDQMILTLVVRLSSPNANRLITSDLYFPSLKNIFHFQLGSDESIAVMSRTGQSVFASEGFVYDSHFVFKEHHIQQKNRFDLFYPMSELPWCIIIQKSVQLSSGLINFSKREIIFVYIIAFLFGTLIAFLLSKWIVSPLKRLVSHITEVGRGNFSHKIPRQHDALLDRLALLFNYMAKEMSHLQKLNVSEIIDEKIKTETIIRHIADGVLVTDTQDRIIMMNSAAENWFGLHERNTYQKLIQKVIKIKSLIDLIQDVKNGKPKQSSDFQFRVFGSNQLRMFQANAARVHNQDNKLLGIVTVLRDVTKEREIDQLKTDLVSMVAHELKAPLTSIYGFSELLTEADLNDTQASEYAGVIQTESSRLTELVNKFLDLSRLEQGRVEIKWISFQVDKLVERVVVSQQQLADKKQIRLITKIPDGPLVVSGDSDLIEQVVINLLSNAIKYSPSGSKIGIELNEKVNIIEISVIDNGYGIPKESLSKIFNKFYRVVDPNTPEDVEGSGLGLALVREIVERHGSEIKVQSKPGVGSVFRFSLKRITSYQLDEINQ